MMDDSKRDDILNGVNEVLGEEIKNRVFFFEDVRTGSFFVRRYSSQSFY